MSDDAQKRFGGEWSHHGRVALGLVALHWSLLVGAADDGIVEEVVVVGAKTERPLRSTAAQVDVLDRESLDRQQLADLGAISRYAPSLETDITGSRASGNRFGSNGLAIRGIGGNRVALELDGVPLPQQFDVGEHADSGRLAVDPAIIKRIEILRGPASALYGSDAIGGVVAIGTFDGRDLVSSGERHYSGLRGGWFGVDRSASGSATYAWSGTDDSLLLSVGHRAGHERSDKGREVAADQLDFSQWQLFGKWTRHFNGGGHLRVSADYFARETDSDLRTRLGYGRFAASARLRGDDGQSRYRITSEYGLPDFGWADQADLTLYFQRSHTDQRTDEHRRRRGAAADAPPSTFIERDFLFTERAFGGEIRLRRNFRSGPMTHLLVAGVEWDRRHLRERRDAQQTTLATATTSKNVLGERFPLRDLPLSTTDKAGLFIQDEIQIGNLTFIPALRWDSFDLDAQPDDILAAHVTPVDRDGGELTLRLGAIWQFREDWSAYAHYAEGFRNPPAKDVNLFLDLVTFAGDAKALPNPDLQAEHLRNLEAGIRLRRYGSAIDVAVYHARYDDFIESLALIGSQTTGAAGGRRLSLFQSRNLEKASIHGVELRLQQSLGHFHEALQRWQIEGGLHWARGENDVTDRPLNSVNPLKAVSRFRWESESGTAASELRVTHYGKQGRADFSDATFFVPDAATIVDFVFEWRRPSHLQWRFGVYNAAGKRYWRYADVRRLTAGDPQVEAASQPGAHAALTVQFDL